MPTILEPSDLDPFANVDVTKAQAMIDDALALAARVAPCLATTSDDGVVGAARAILRGAVLRWHEAGAGAYQAQTAGPFAVTMDTRQERRGMFYPSEITALQGLCPDTNQGGVYSVSIAGV